jgi:hypothetical protein
MHTRTMKVDDDGDVVQEVVVVKTDIEAPKGTAFEKVDGQTLNVDLDPAMDADNDGTANNDLTALAVGTDLTTDPVEAVLKLVMSDAFVPGAGSETTELTFARFQLDSDGDTDGNQTVQAYTTPGTYNGAMGTYRCSRTDTEDCTVTLDDEGEITAMSAGWAFIPVKGATSDVADADYLHYGFWLQKTTDKDGVLTYDEVETFAGSSLGMSDGADIDEIQGSASYKGGATGVYVKNVLTPEGKTESATSGHFTAAADLKAYFGQTVDDTTTEGVDEAGAIAPAKLNTVSGTISKFTLSGGEANSWTVDVNGKREDNANTFAGTAKGGGAAGKFSGTYHGPLVGDDVDHDANPDTAALDDVAPPVLVGEFDANFSDGSVAGGFGARKQ